MDMAFLTVNFVIAMMLGTVWVLRILPIRGEYITTILFLIGLGVIYDFLVVQVFVGIVLFAYTYATREEYAAVRAAEVAEFERRFGKQPAN